MTQDEIISFVGARDGVRTFRPVPGDGSPEISWGDTFFYYAPDGTVPTRAQPFATIVRRGGYAPGAPPGGSAAGYRTTSTASTGSAPAAA
ncbi:MAG TPA: DUF6194 family protein [Pilimelia sp.]|nr:DUF6194 family protein [Pilimelia sp.]